MASLDPHNFLGVLYSFPEQIREASKIGNRVQLPEGINKIIIAGMGTSALAGLLLKNLLQNEKIPIFVVKDYKLPSFVDEKTLVFAVTYSGNTEETILMYSDALKKNAKIVIIASGGKIRYLAMEADDVQQVLIPSGLPSRTALAYLFFPIVNILQNNKLIKPRLQEVEGLVSVLKPVLIKDKAKELSEKLVGRIPLIYASSSFYPVALQWKMAFNENAKIHAFCHEFPDLNHNELSGYENMNGNYHVIIIKDQLDHPKITKRMLLMKQTLQELKVPLTEMVMKGKFQMTKMFTSMYLGMFTSYFLALRNDVDPWPVALVDKFNRGLSTR